MHLILYPVYFTIEAQDVYIFLDFQCHGCPRGDKKFNFYIINRDMNINKYNIYCVYTKRIKIKLFFRLRPLLATTHILLFYWVFFFILFSKTTVCFLLVTDF